MKSFLQEIESKFVELEEATFNVPKADLPQIQPKLGPDDIVNVTDKPITELEEHLCEMCGKVHEGNCSSHNEEIEEASNTGGVAGYQTPASFAKRSNWKNKNVKYEMVQEAMDRKYERLIESYRQFSRGDKKITPEQKVSRTIQEVSKKLRQIETLVKHTSKLKEESGMSRDNYGPRTEKALNKISEKLIKIAERVRAIGE